MKGGEKEDLFKRATVNRGNYRMNEERRCCCWCHHLLTRGILIPFYLYQAYLWLFTKAMNRYRTWCKTIFNESMLHINLQNTPSYEPTSYMIPPSFYKTRVTLWAAVEAQKSTTSSYSTLGCFFHWSCHWIIFNLETYWIEKNSKVASTKVAF